MKTPMKRTLDLRTRVSGLIKAIEEVPPKHLSPAMVRLLADLKNATARYDEEAQDQ